MEINAKHHTLHLDDGELSIKYSSELLRISKIAYYTVLIAYILFFIFRRFSGFWIPAWINFSWAILFFSVVLFFASQKMIAHYGKNRIQKIMVSDISSIKFGSGNREIKVVLYANKMRFHEVAFISKEEAALFIKEMEKANPSIEWLHE